MPKLSPGYATVGKSTVKICQRDLKVAALKQIAALFMELPLWSLPQANYQGNKMSKGITQSAVKFVSETLSW